MKKGFTLVEILLVVVIFGMLAVIVIPQFSSVNSEKCFLKTGMFEDDSGEYSGFCRVGFAGREVCVRESLDEYIHARDLNNDGRFDEITITLPKDHPLEKYSNLEGLEALYLHFLEPEEDS